MTKRLVLAAFLALAACGGGPKPVEPVGNGTPAPAGGFPATAYAGLFTDGATYRYKVESSSGQWDPDANGMVYDKSTAEMTCTVGNVTQLADRIAATLTCNDDVVQVPIADATPSGTYVATAAGLWRVDGADAELDPAAMLLTAEPAPRTDRKEEPGGEFGSEIKVAQRADGAWCWDHALWGGDDGSTTLCFAGGTLSGGGAAFGGGSTHEVTYTLLR
jgi:hypothetical protein